MRGESISHSTLKNNTLVLYIIINRLVSYYVQVKILYIKTYTTLYNSFSPNKNARACLWYFKIFLLVHHFLTSTLLFYFFVNCINSNMWCVDKTIFIPYIYIFFFKLKYNIIFKIFQNASLSKYTYER